MKSPNKIKKALGQCSAIANCAKCPYHGEKCIEHMCADALEYIKQLEPRNIKPLARSLRLRLWRLFHPLKWRKMKKIRLDEMHEFKFVHRDPVPDKAIIIEEVSE